MAAAAIRPISATFVGVLKCLGPCCSIRPAVTKRLQPLAYVVVMDDEVCAIYVGDLAGSYRLNGTSIAEHVAVKVVVDRPNFVVTVTPHSSELLQLYIYSNNIGSIH